LLHKKSVKSKISPNRNIHKYTYNSSDGKTRGQIDHVLIRKKTLHSSIGKLPVGKRAAQNFDMGGFKLWKLNDVEIKEEYQVKISNILAAFENFDYDDDEEEEENVVISGN